jgi:hypothetical protein
MTRHESSNDTTTSTDSGAPRRPLLPGQESDHRGPVDLTVMYLVHHAFRRDLADFAAAVPLTPVEDRAAWQALRERWGLFSAVLHHHHTGEDVGLWPLLLERLDAEGDVDGRATLEAMAAEHDDIDPLLAACEAGFDRLAQTPDDDARAALTVRVVAAREHLARHLRHEEVDALALVQRHLSQADWLALEKTHFKAEYGFRDTVRMVNWVLEGLPASALEGLRRDRATRPLLLLGRLGRRGFARRQHAAFGHLRGHLGDTGPSREPSASVGN